MKTQESAAILDLSARGRIRVTGEDRARLLHAMTTNHVQQMKPGDGVYAFFLNAQGRIQADVYMLCFADHFLLDTEPETRAVVYEHLDRYIIADDVTLEDVSDATFCIGLEGDSANRVATSAGLPELATPYSHSAWGEYEVAAISATGYPAFRVYGAAERKADALQIVAAAGGIEIGAERIEQMRTHRYRPRFGQDITDATLPQESQQMHALHFQKGCYLGQEIVERIRSRGHVNKHLMGFHLRGSAAPEAGTRVTAEGKEAGDVTSAAVDSDGNVYGLAQVRVPYNNPGATVLIDGNEAELFTPARA